MHSRHRNGVKHCAGHCGRTSWKVEGGEYSRRRRAVFADVARVSRRETTMKVARILVVDDEPQLRRVMKAALTKQGYIVGDARSGEAALERLREERYDLIILDRNMPGIGGVEACRSIRERSDVGIIMLTIRKEIGRASCRER